MAKTITFALSDSLHRRFKNYCNNKGLKVKDALVLAVEIIMQKKKK